VTSATRARGIATWTIDLPAGWFTVPMGELDAHAQTEWIDGVVAQVEEMAVEPGSPSALRAQLGQMRGDLIARRNPWLNAAVLVRPESLMSIGCLLTTSVLGLEAGDGPDAFATLLERGFAEPDRGTRSHDASVWRERIGVGELVGAYQRFDTVDYGEGVGMVEDRTIFGIFPDDSVDMVQLEFRAADLGTYRDMIEETSALVRTARVTLEETA
jgi:hypothetical protein